ncbi:MAG: UDP-4-amino-4,6-dideoxy-N-acetyl-beta-L-altrosamine transaminase [Spongiibacteraceae bacterium]|nr:UDP-4-amino-4,6-dideoxy-N-acetyl-beta-L-altrosamine transaminase [Spongiibacteraceae bacterium]
MRLETQKFIPFAAPDIGDAEIAAVVECLRSGWLTTGLKTKEFERLFAEFVGVKHALAVNSCTAALHLALEAYGVGPGDKVLTTPFTFTATAETVRYLGADPVFADIDPHTMNIDPVSAERVLQSDVNFKALLPVHYAGLPCDMNALGGLAEKYDLKVIEDAAHALPCSYKGRAAGSLGDVGAFSFYATKTLCTGEGGMVTTDDDSIAERIRTMRLHGISRDVFDRYQSEKPSWYYEVVAPGFKYNMPDTAAAMGIEQLSRAKLLRERRQSIADYYNSQFSGLPIDLPPAAATGDEHAWHLYVIRLQGINPRRDEFIQALADRGVGASVHFIPLHVQPYWRERYQLKPDDFPVAYDVYRRCVSLPIYTKMSDADVERVADSVKLVLASFEQN